MARVKSASPRSSRTPPWKAAPPCRRSRRRSCCRATLSLPLSMLTTLSLSRRILARTPSISWPKIISTTIWVCYQLALSLSLLAFFSKTNSFFFSLFFFFVFSFSFLLNRIIWSGAGTSLFERVLACVACKDLSGAGDLDAAGARRREAAQALVPAGAAEAVVHGGGHAGRSEE